MRRNELIKMFGLRVAFLATQSGLTRWMDFDMNKTNELEPDQRFQEVHNRATDEVWYIRAVEQHLAEQQSFVFSVPFDVGAKEDTLVTASHAIFLNEDARSAPAAVVGYQFQHSALYNLFKNITSKCGDSRDSCDADIKCFTEDGKIIDAGCYVLDNSGYVIVSPNREETGVFFGDVREWLMKRFVEENIYRKVTINNYQGVCAKDAKSDFSSGNVLYGPIKHFINIFIWLRRVVIWAFTQLTMVTPADSYPNYEDYGLFLLKLINLDAGYLFRLVYLEAIQKLRTYKH